MSTTIEVRERPILFSGEMVQAILDGHKVQTRRVVRTPMAFRAFYTQQGRDPRSLHDAARDARIDHETGDAWFLVSGDHGWYGPVRCPYGQQGSRLWVRETWRESGAMQRGDGAIPREHPGIGEVIYAADRGTTGPWRPSIYMPRWASRITLEVTDVRVERVQQISESDARAEGAPLGRILGYGVVGEKSHREGFIDLWDGINARRGLGWEENPWVWAVGFRRVA